MTPTFEEFQTSKQSMTTEEFTTLLPNYKDSITAPDVLVYMGNLYIEDWGINVNPKYHLTLDREEFLSDDLTHLEKALYQWEYL